MFEIDINGNLIRELNLPLDYGQFNKIFELNDTSYLVLGYFNDTFSLMKIDTSFNIKWIKNPFLNTAISNFGLQDGCLSYDNKSIAMAGACYIAPDLTFTQYILTKISIDGNLINYRLDSSGYSVSIICNTDNGYIVGSAITYLDSNLAQTKSKLLTGGILFSIVLNNNTVFGSGICLPDTTGSELYIVKVNQYDNYARLGINEVEAENNNVTIYPNPAINELNITTTQKLTVQLFDITGKQVTENISVDKTTTINTQSLSQGIYFLKINDANSGSVKTQKVVVMK